MDGKKKSAKPKEKGCSEQTENEATQTNLDLTHISPVIMQLNTQLVAARTKAEMLQKQLKELQEHFKEQVKDHKADILKLGEAEGKLKIEIEKNQELTRQIRHLQQDRSMTHSESTQSLSRYDVKGTATVRESPDRPRSVICANLNLADQEGPFSMRTDIGNLSNIEGCSPPVETPRPRTSGSDLEQASEPDPQFTPPDEGSDFHYSNDGANRGAHDQPTGSSLYLTAAEELDTENELLDQATGGAFGPVNRSNERSSRYSNNIPHGLTQEQSISACSSMNYRAVTSDIQQHADNQTSDGSMHNNGSINRNIQNRSPTSSQNLHPAYPQSARPRK